MSRWLTCSTVLLAFRGRGEGQGVGVGPDSQNGIVKLGGDLKMSVSPNKDVYEPITSRGPGQRHIYAYWC